MTAILVVRFYLSPQLLLLPRHLSLKVLAPNALGKLRTHGQGHEKTAENWANGISPHLGGSSSVEFARLGAAAY
jgi:hypothetical protein